MAPRPTATPCGTIELVHLPDGSAWPRALTHVTTLEWLLRYGGPDEVVALRMQAASIVAAYCELVAVPQRKRELVVRTLRRRARG